MDARSQRLKEIRRELGLLLDEANLLTDDQPTDECQWVETMMDLLEALDARDSTLKSS